MTLSGTDRGQGTHNTGATSFTFSPGSNFGSGVAWLCVAADNAGSGGAAFATFSASDNAGGTWTRRQTALIDPNSASAGQAGAIFERSGGSAMTTSTVITVSFGSDSPVAKTWTLMEVSGSTGTPVYVTGNVGTGGTGTTSPTITTGSITNGNMVIAALFLEAGTTQTITQDGDTTNGSWSAQQTAEIGATTSGSNIASQRKVVTATATQTYNPTLGLSGDLCLAWVEITEAAAQTYTPALLDQAAATFTPTVTSLATIAPALIDRTAATFTPTVAPGAAPVTIGLLSQTAVTFTPTVTATAGIVVALIDRTASPFEPTVDTSSNAAEWTTPADGVAMPPDPELKFLIPSMASPMHFNLQLDTVATFDSGDLRDLRSDLDQTGWAFWDGDSWEPVPVGGVDESFAGNEARYTVSPILTSTTWYRRVRAGTP